MRFCINQLTVAGNTATFFYWSSANKPGKWAVMPWCVVGIDFISLYYFDIFEFGIVPTVWYAFGFFYVASNK
jgi:hypothetical protein